jgi:iron complex outermembrane receptor protein
MYYINIIILKRFFDMNLNLILNTKIFFLTIFVSFNILTQEQFIEDVIVTAEKRSESLQTVSQAVTAITDSELEAKNITSFVDLNCSCTWSYSC